MSDLKESAKEVYGLINVVSRNEIWEFRAAREYKQLLFKKDGTPKKEVEELVEFLEKKNMEWDIAYYKSVVAFKNPCERITWIYPKRYFDGRMRDSFKRLDILRLSEKDVNNPS